jgi:hypothetical protein
MILGREPVLFYAVIAAVINLVTLLGLNLSDAQQGAILAVTTAVLGLLARSKVSPVDSDGNPILR